MGIIEKLLGMLGLNRVSPESLTRKAKAFAAREDIMASVESYKKALELDPLYVPAYDGLGRVYFRLGFKEEADREFAIADGLEKLSKDPSDVDASVKMGWALIAKGLNRQAAGLLEPVFQRTPRNPDLIKILGTAYKILGIDKRARELFQIGLERWPREPEFYIQLGALEEKVGNKELGQRLTNMGRAFSRLSDPNDAASRYELARYFYQGTQFNDATEYMRQALSIDRNNADYWFFLGDCYVKAGQHPVALDALRQAGRLAPSDPRPQQMLALVYRLLGKFDEAKAAKDLATMLEAGQKETRTPQDAAKFVKYMLSIGRNEEAEARLGELLAVWPDSPDLRMIQGRLMFRDKQYPEAVALLKEVARERDTWAEPHMWMAMAYQRLGDNMSALAEGQLATRLAPKSHTAHKVLGDILREQKKFSMAENAYETAEHLKAARKEK